MPTRPQVKFIRWRVAAILVGLALLVAGVFVVPPWHFEDRHARNAIPSGLAELESPLWTELPKELSIYHDDGIGANERKFVRPDENSFLGLGGHEAIWNPDTESLIDEGPYRGTYNYVNPGGFLRGVGHVIFDVVPYWFGGTERGGEGTTFFERVTGRQLDEVPATSKAAMAVAALALAALLGWLVIRARRRRRTADDDGSAGSEAASSDLSAANSDE